MLNGREPITKAPALERWRQPAEAEADADLLVDAEALGEADSEADEDADGLGFAVGPKDS
jgi:hypothetical protein